MTSPPPSAPSKRLAPGWCRSPPTWAPGCSWPRSATPTATTSGCGSSRPTPRRAEAPPPPLAAGHLAPGSVDGDRQLLSGRILGLGLGLRLGVHHTDREGERPAE